MKRLTSTRWPTSSVGSIDSEGIWYGLITQAWIASASPRASATMTTSSTSPPPLLFGFRIESFRLDPRRSRRHRPAPRPRHPPTLGCPPSYRPPAPLRPDPPRPQSLPPPP